MPSTGVTSVGLVESTVLPVPVEVVTPVPPLATGRVPDTCVVRLTPERVPPRVKLPLLVTVPVRVMPLTVPVPATEVTVPLPPPPAALSVVPVNDRFVPRVISSVLPSPAVALPSSLAEVTFWILA